MLCFWTLGMLVFGLVLACVVMQGVRSAVSCVRAFLGL